MSQISLKVNTDFTKWGIGTLYGFLDQGLFSATNFITNILLARWLPEEEYGAFAVALSFYILVSTVHSALITEPMLVFGPTQHEDHLSDYISKQIWVHFQLVPFLSLLLAIGAVFAISKVQFALVGAALAMPFSLILWLFRRACYIKMQTNLALILSLIYSIVVFSGLFLFRRISFLTPLIAYLIMGLASIVAGMFATTMLRVRLKRPKNFGGVFIANRVFLENWRFGKWILVASIADGIINVIYPPIIGFAVNLGQAAALRSVQNLILPLQQIHTAISLMTIPWLSRRASQLGITYVYKNLPKIVGIYVAPMVLYTIPLILFSKPLASVIYGNRFYSNYTWLIPMLSISYFFTSVGLALVVSIRSIKLSKPLVWSKICAALVVLTLGIILILRWALYGVVISIYLSTIIEFLILIVIFIKVFKGNSGKNLLDLQR